MPEKEHITLVVACDNHYLIMLAALLKSIEINHHTEEFIDVWVVEDHITTKNKKKLHASIGDKMNIRWISMKDAIPKGMHLPLDKNTYPLNIFMRLFIPYFLPQSIEKAIYLDVDMLVLKDISELWHTAIEGNIAGAVTDSICKTIDRGMKNHKALGLNSEAPYFNSGLLLMDLKKWLQHDITPKVIECVNENRDFAAFSDQYGLNYALYGQWKELDPLWNYYSNGDNPQPFLIHFFHRKPFYLTYPYNPEYQGLFYAYLNQTQWQGQPPIGELKRYLVKIGNIVEKIPLLLRNLLNSF